MSPAMLTGAHVSVFSAKPEADVAFLKDVLGLPNVDAGGGRLIFGLPPAEIMIHETDADSASLSGTHELYLMASNIEELVGVLENKGVACEARQDQGWGVVSGFALPSGTKLKVYEPRHARPSESKKGAKALKKTVKVVREAAKKAKKAAKAGAKAEKKTEKKTEKKKK
jgi:catechol 2,3-dioxygenase-like lactoylglutathione lyase family enzyme